MFRNLVRVIIAFDNSLLNSLLEEILLIEILNGQY